MEASLDRPQGQTERRRDLAVAQSFLVEKRQGGAFLDVQRGQILFQRAQQSVLIQPQRGILRWTGKAFPQRRFGVERYRAPRLPLAVPFVAHHVHDDAVKKRRDGSFVAKSGQTSKQTQEHFLRQVLDVSRAGEPGESPEDHALVLLDDPSKVLQDRQTGFTENCFTFARKSETRAAAHGLTVAKGIGRRRTMNFVGFTLVLGICVILPIAGMTTAYMFRRLSSRERLEAIQKGVSIPIQATNPLQRAARVRRSGIVLLALGIGLALSLVVASLVEGDKDALIGAAFGSIPALIGVGLLIDYNLLRKELGKEQ
jgi:hypothetical protein